MPLKLVRAAKIFHCPICDEKGTVYFSDPVKEGDSTEERCRHCLNLLEFTITKDGLTVTPPEQSRNKKVIEKCPNCQIAWEMWIGPSNELVQVYGATSLNKVVMNYRCNTCHSDVAYSR